MFGLSSYQSNNLESQREDGKLYGSFAGWGLAIVVAAIAIPILGHYDIGLSQLIDLTGKYAVAAVPGVLGGWLVIATLVGRALGGHLKEKACLKRLQE